MPIAIFEFAYESSQAGEDGKAAMQRLQKALSSLAKSAIRAEILKHEGYEVSVANVAPLKGRAGVTVEVAMDEPPRRADTVKTILDSLERIRSRIDIIFDFNISSEFADANWARIYSVTSSSKLKATRGFKLGSTRRRSWWFPIGFFLGCAVTFYALNFATVNQQVGEQIQRFKQEQP